MHVPFCLALGERERGICVAVSAVSYYAKHLDVIVLNVSFLHFAFELWSHNCWVCGAGSSGRVRPFEASVGPTWLCGAGSSGVHFKPNGLRTILSRPNWPPEKVQKPKSIQNYLQNTSKTRR